MKAIVRLVAVFLLVLGVIGCAQESIRVGIVGPMGYMPGEQHWQGALMAAEEINEAGGITIGDRAYRLELVRVDSNELHSVSDAVIAVERAITGQRVDFLVGGYRSEAVFPMTEVAVDHGKIFLIAGAAADTLLKGRVDEDYDRYKYLFRVTPIRSTDLARLSILLLIDVVETFRDQLGIDRPRVAVVAERAEWAEELVRRVETLISAPLPHGLGGEHVGTWRPSALASDVRGELTAIERAGAHIIYTAFSGPVGVPFGREWGRLEIPAATVGINVQAQSGTWLEDTHGHGAYTATAGIYARDVAVTPATVSFVEEFVEQFDELPLYTAATYDAVHILAAAIAEADSLLADDIVSALEDTDYPGTMARFVFDDLHDLMWGPGYATGLGVQWVDDRAQAFWPRGWHPDPVNFPDLTVTYPGTIPYQIPPWVVDHWGSVEQ